MFPSVHAQWSCSRCAAVSLPQCAIKQLYLTTDWTPTHLLQKEWSCLWEQSKCPHTWHLLPWWNLLIAPIEIWQRHLWKHTQHSGCTGLIFFAVLSSLWSRQSVFVSTGAELAPHLCSDVGHTSVRTALSLRPQLLCLFEVLLLACTTSSLSQKLSEGDGKAEPLSCECCTEGICSVTEMQHNYKEGCVVMSQSPHQQNMSVCMCVRFVLSRVAVCIFLFSQPTF